MTALPNFPHVSQLTSVTSDGQISENAAFDCVPASIGAAILYYQGKSAWDSEINPDRLKDAGVGQGRTGGTAAADYIDFCRSLGYDLTAIHGTPEELTAAAHNQIQQGRPVVFTEPDPYVPASRNWSHVCVFHAETAGELTALDPYIARDVTRSDAEWQRLLQFGEIWVLIHPGQDGQTGDIPMLQLTDPWGKYFSENAQGWHCQKTGVDLIGDHLQFYRRYGGVFRLPLTNELRLAQFNPPVAKADTAIVVYEGAVVAWDMARLIDNPPTDEHCYLLHIDSGIGQAIIAKPLITELTKQVADLTAQISQLKQAGQPADPTLQAKLNAYVQAMASIKSISQSF